MSAQPSNTAISIYRNVRGQRNIRRNDTVEAITKRLRPLYLIVPSKEKLTEIKTRDTAKKDFSAYGRDGQPIVIGAKADVTFDYGLSHLSDIAFPIKIGEDQFITNSADGLTGDLFHNAASL